MSRNIKVHQLLHGYRSGHGLLGGSTKLGSRDSELVTRLSDLSGSLSSGLEIEPYLTCYPLPSGQFYAVARTWLDTEAPRAGCVLTHTILIPKPTWATLKNVRAINRYFRNSRLHPDHAFTDSIEIDDGDGYNPGTNEGKVDLDSTRTFVSRYFGQGVRPIVWLNAEKPEQYLWRLLEHLWPRLRSAFSCCTCSLQPRQLQDRPFDLLFAPSAVFSRFTKLSSDHILEEGKIQRPSDVETEAWCSLWAQGLFSGQTGLPSGEDELPIWNELGEDPADLRKLTLIHELRLRAATSPTAGVGAIDVVESLARDAQAGTPLKTTVFNSAIQSASTANDVEEGLTALRLIEDRLRREAFKDVSLGLRGAVETASSQLAAREPVTGIKVLESLSNSSQDTTELQNGILHGLCSAAQRDGSIIREFENYPSTAIRLLNLEPSLAAAYLQSAGPAAPNQIVSWLASTRDIDVLRTVRKAILPTLKGTESEEVIAALLRDVASAEVSWTLDHLFRAGGNFTSTSFLKVVIDRISSVYPAEVRRWGTQAKQQGVPAAATLLATTFQDGPAGYEEFLSEARFSGEQKARVLAEMLELHARSGMPYWLREVLAKNKAFVDILLSARSSAPEFFDAALFRVLEEVEDVRLPESAAAHLEDFAGSRIYSLVVDKVMRASLVESLISENKKWAGNDGANMEAGDRWLRDIPAGQLSSLLTRGAAAGAEGVWRAWTWVAEARRSLYQRRDVAVAEIVESLLPQLRQYSDERTETAVAAVVKRMKSDSPSEPFQTAAAKSLRFAFDNTHLALGAVVAESFPDVYRVAASDRRQPSFLSLLFWSYDWDKGKELRIALVDSFLRSSWKPGYLALASERAGILAKIFKRVRRKPRADDYIAAIAKDLQGRTSPEWSKVRERFLSMMADPDFYEEWD